VVTGNSISKQHRKQLLMTSSPEVNSTPQRNMTSCFKYGVQSQSRAWILCFLATFLVGLIVNVLVACKATRWHLLRTRLRHFRPLGDAVIGHVVSGVTSCCCGTLIMLATLAATPCQLTPEILCRAGATLPQMVLSSATYCNLIALILPVIFLSILLFSLLKTFKALNGLFCADVPLRNFLLSSATCVMLTFVFSYCDSITLCRRLQKVLSTVRKVAPVIVGLATAAIALGDPSFGSWLDSGCISDSVATYRLPTVLAAVCFIASTAGTILVLSSHMTLRRPTNKMAAELLPVPLMELQTADEDGPEVGGSHVASGGDVIAAPQTCRISCEAAVMSGQQDVDEVGSWRCSSKMGLPASSSSSSSSS